MMKINFRSFLKSFKNGDKKKDNAEKSKQPKQSDASDPIASVANGRRKSFEENESPIKISVRNFPFHDLASEAPIISRAAMDSITPTKNATAMDSAMCDPQTGDGYALGPTVPNAIMNWYFSQSFIGYQACALIAQHWLVDKACSMSGEDACRNGWELSVKGNIELDQEQNERLKALDVEYKLMHNLAELNRFKNVFGIRIAIFEVESEDENYYSNPFNIDGVTEGSYKGISQVDPYWTTPMMSSRSTSNPSSMDFYDPEYWIIAGKKYHRSHLIIARGPQPADILKPTYMFGGIPLTQRIYERVYAAERTANEAPLLAMTKRTTGLHVDLDGVTLNQDKFEERLRQWIAYRDNHGVKVLGKEEVMEQFDTNLSDFDSIIMNQFQLVAAIAKTPATELLGTSPKGFNATGEFEMKSYNKELGSIQSHVYQPLLDRHYMLLAKSHAMDMELEAIFNPVDTPTADELATLNDKKADTDTKNVNIGAISPEDVRNRLKADNRSGYNALSDENAEEEPGMSPENIAALEKSAGEETSMTPGDIPSGAAVSTPPAPAPEQVKEDALPAAPQVVQPVGAPSADPVQGTRIESLLGALAERLTAIEEFMIPEGTPPAMANPARARTTKPGVIGLEPTVRGAADLVPPLDPSKLPKMKLHGMVLVIENPQGTIRSGQSMSGDSWQVTMPAHYGFIKGVAGADGDELDCFVGDQFDSKNVFVINQNDANTKEFDEHKVMLGFSDAASAYTAYTQAHDSDWNGAESVWEMDVESFKQWMKSGCEEPIDESCVGAKPHTMTAA